MVIISAVANIGTEQLKCNGSIQIRPVNDRQFYIEWKLFFNNEIVASVADNYFVGNKSFSEEELVMEVIKKIENYRIDRKKIFTKAEIVEL